MNESNAVNRPRSLPRSLQLDDRQRYGAVVLICDGLTYEEAAVEYSTNKAEIEKAMSPIIEWGKKKYGKGLKTARIANKMLVEEIESLKLETKKQTTEKANTNGKRNRELKREIKELKEENRKLIGELWQLASIIEHNEAVKRGIFPALSKTVKSGEK